VDRRCARGIKNASFIAFFGQTDNRSRVYYRQWRRSRACDSGYFRIRFVCLTSVILSAMQAKENCWKKWASWSFMKGSFIRENWRIRVGFWKKRDICKKNFWNIFSPNSIKPPYQKFLHCHLCFFLFTKCSNFQILQDWKNSEMKTVKEVFFWRMKHSVFACGPL